MGWLGSNPAANATPPRVPRHEIRPPTPAEVGLLLEIAAREDAELAMFVRLAAATGARRGEICALRWSHLDGSSVLISRALVEAADGFVEKDTKTHAGRRVALDRSTMEALEAYRRMCGDRAEVLGVELRPDGFVFSGDAMGTTPWRPDGVTKRFIAALRDEAWGAAPDSCGRNSLPFDTRVQQ